MSPNPFLILENLFTFFKICPVLLHSEISNDLSSNLLVFLKFVKNSSNFNNLKV
jgi:hypothetical protein